MTEHPEYEEVRVALKAKIESREVDEGELREEFMKYLSYGVPPREAAKTIMRHYGTAPKEAPAFQVNPDPVPLDSIKAGDNNITVTARIHSMQSRTIVARGEEKELLTGVLLDESGALDYTSWRPLEGLSVGDVVTVKGAYAKEYRGATQLNFGDRTVIEKVPAEEAGDLPTEIPPGPRLAVHEALQQSRKNVTIQASLVAVKPNCGLVFRDASTNRVLAAGKNPAGAKPDLRFMGVFDDGTDSISVYAGRDATQAILGKTLEECQEMAREAFRSEVVREELEKALMGRVLTVRGDVEVKADGDAIVWAHSITAWTGTLEDDAQAGLAALDAGDS